MSSADRREQQIQRANKNRAVVQYNPAEDSEYRRMLDPNLRARAGAGNTRSQDVTRIAPGVSSKAEENQRASYRANQILGGVNFPSMASLMAGMAGGRGGMDASDSLALRKYQDELAKEKRMIQAYQNMLSGGGYREGTDAILGMIGSEGARSSGEVEKAYQAALANIAGGYETAQGLTTQAYGALENYLRQNPNNPFANVQVSAGTAPDAMEQILSAYGVSADPVRAQVAAEQAAAQQGAAGFQNLLGTLGGVAQQADLSRLAEMEMARTLAGQTLGAQRATYSSQAEQSRAQALAQIQAQLAQARIEQEIAAQARRQQLQDAIAAAGGTIPSGSSGGGGGDKGAGGESDDERRRKELLAQMVANAAAGGGTGVNLGQMVPYAI